MGYTVKEVCCLVVVRVREDNCPLLFLNSNTEEPTLIVIVQLLNVDDGKLSPLSVCLISLAETTC